MKYWSEIFENFNIFEFFKNWGETAPKNLKDVERLEQAYREENNIKMADLLWEWRVALEYHIYREFDDSLYEQTEDFVIT